ncbi:MAG: cell filamentation protein Fic [bacterium (Candidatus Stahlbacteria) CG08_land_8_20_14_0_20_40_26]|nr:MAG: cell filamentation protein Fic [bacterium (Candidatus Stahlbacteria) CG23_combo_of_CG06-09_8_20_14_all_40_9]PIS23948.1 MAG: cell filamentation protein Fic [bacterium (Candidatus Stahlbacteria) CG08_land_8_20_14_0_20_40_26]
MIEIGRSIKQVEGYKAFIPAKFPGTDLSFIKNEKIISILSQANFMVGKLDGLTRLLPDIDFFIFMYVKKEATYSSQIEGTRARLTDALHAELDKTSNLPEDVDDILHYIQAMNKGLEELGKIPLSLRLIKEIHKVLLTEARSSQYPLPGEFRRDQNWINGTSPYDAHFVPPPPQYILNAIGDLEKFFYSHKEVPVLIKAGLIHAQFETIHPFRDGNGRAGRLLITFYLCQQKVLERPVLYLSEFLKRYRDTYFARLDGYRKGGVIEWLDFFLKGITTVAQEAIDTADKIVELREKDIGIVSFFGKKTSKGAMILLKQLYKSPIVNITAVRKATGFSRQGAYNLINKFIEAGILTPTKDKYGKRFIYKDYLDLFESSLL